MKNTLPQFFNYKEDKVDAGYEALHDFFLSWTLRCAVENYAAANPKVQRYAKAIVLHLLALDGFNEYCIEKVETKKQSGHIDLLVEVTIKNKQGETTLYVLNIENKWYTKATANQLEKYNRIICDNYAQKQAQIINLVLLPDHVKIADNQAICDSYNYRIETFEVLKDLLTEGKTGNDLFDEFWFNFY